MLSLADICRSYPDYEDKSKYMDILVRHWGKDGKGTAAKEQFPIENEILLKLKID